MCLCLGSWLSAGESLWKTSLLSQLNSVSRETDACWQRKMLLFLLVERCCDIKATPAGVVWVYKRCVMSFISPPAICLDGENQNVFLLPMMGKVCQPLFVCLSWKSQIYALIVAEEEIEIAKNSFICSISNQSGVCIVGIFPCLCVINMERLRSLNAHLYRRLNRPNKAKTFIYSMSSVTV